MAACPDLPPVVWKSDFYGTPEAFELLDGVVDVYVADFKFGNDQCASRLAGVGNYTQILKRNLLIAAKQARLIIRHLLLPGHYDCCYQPILQWLKQNLPDAALSLRDGYLPSWRARHFEEISKPLEARVANNARELANGLGLMVIQ
jgi:putative pyruvate formate lyase activating enzyme